MWNYLWGHVVYHLTRWFPKNDRNGIRIVLLAFSVAFLVPQLIVVLSQESQRFCERNLLNYTIVALCFTMFMIGFSFLLLMMEPVVWQIKVAFHIYGFGCFVFTALYLVEVLGASSCKTTTASLYYLSLAFAILGAIATGIYAILVPFWVANRLCPKSVLNKTDRTGACYEPVSCCSCVWHV